MSQELYFSIDIETTGPAPGLNSMISLGCAVFTREGPWQGDWPNSFGLNLQEMEGTQRHPETMRFWETHPEAWKIATQDPQSPLVVMSSFVEWVDGFPGRKIAAAWPAAFDFAFVNYYCHRWAEYNPLGFACLDIRSLAQGLTYSRGYYDLRENQLREIQAGVDNSDLIDHVAVHDAVGQGRLLVALLARTKGGPK